MPQEVYVTAGGAKVENNGDGTVTVSNDHSEFTVDADTLREAGENAADEWGETGRGAELGESVAVEDGIVLLNDEWSPPWSPLSTEAVCLTDREGSFVAINPMQIINSPDAVGA